MKKVIMILVVLVVTLSGCNQEPSEISVNNAVPVRLAQSKVDMVEESYVTFGQVTADKSLDLMLPMGSRIEEIFVLPGQGVAKDQSLLAYSWNGENQVLESPQQGIISNIYGVSGSMVEGPVIRLVDEVAKGITAMLSRELKDQLAIGDPVELIYKDGSQGQGHILHLDQDAEPFSRLHEAFIQVEDIPVEFGEFVSLRFVTDRREAILVPAKAIVRRKEGQYIYQFADGDLIKLRVETGLSKGEWIELVDMSPGTFEFVIAGQNFITDEDAFVVVD